MAAVLGVITAVWLSGDVELMKIRNSTRSNDFLQEQHLPCRSISVTVCGGNGTEQLIVADLTSSGRCGS